MATDKIYPATALDSPSRFMSTMGSYWSRDFPDRDVLTSFIGGRLRMFDQTRIDAAETAATYSRLTIPVYHTEQWLPMYFTRSGGTVVASVPAVYGASKALYGEASVNPPYDQVIKYGMNLIEGTSRALPLPSGVQSVRMLTNRIADPSIVLLEGIDFFVDLDAGLILLNDDLLDNQDIARASGVEAGTERLLLWAYGVEYDADYIWSHAGYVVGVRAASSTRYRDMVNAIWDSHVAAPSNATVMQLLSAVTDTPTAAYDGEIVELILDSPRKQVITDKSVYTVSSDATVIVSVGDVLSKWQQLTDTIEMYPLYNVDDGLTLYSAPITKTPVDIQATISTPDGPDPSAYFSPSRKFTHPMSFYQNWYFSTGGTLCDTAENVAKNAVSYGTVLKYESFNGYFTNETVTLTRGSLAAHSYVRLKFRLAIVGEWRGNSNDSRFTLSSGGTTYIDTTFSNLEADPQAYPDAAGAANAAFTGARRKALTGGAQQWLAYSDTTVDGYAEYEIDVTIPHTAASFVAEYTVSGLPSDSWCVAVPVRLSPKTYAVDGLDPADIICDGQESRPSRLPIFRGKYTTEEYIATYGEEPTLDAISMVWWSSPAAFRETLTSPAAFWGIYEPTLELITVANRQEIRTLPSQVEQLVDVPGITLDSHLLRGVYFEGLFFENKDVALEYVGADSEGRVEVRFEVSGYPGDVEQYWEDVHTRGKANGLTLANYLDQRPNPVGDPLQHHLPAVVNPLLLVLRHVLGYNLFVIKLKSGNEGSDALDSKYLSLLRDVTPPHSAYIIFTELVVEPEEMAEPRYSEVAVGQGPVLTEVTDITLTARAPAVQGVPSV